ncbi:hypothetical protein [Ralstonia sp. SET104]|jgi:hypothetical protein|uniref:hypothetical protein n=1 Tax=Ralstonia sp. SET104 TaxID=2448774 RepID=UPI000F58E371|nr:hypothetical protein [Ralstonia sp. SET104]GCB04912.1 hypothetical protein PSUB009319_25430 [Ralstonia sp. SET104]
MKPIQRLALCCVLACAPFGIAHAQLTPAPTGPASASAPNDAKRTAYDSAVKQADANYKVAKDKCDAVKGNDRDVCRAQAKGDYNVAKANAMVDRDGTEAARDRAAKEKAEADYDVAKTKCGAMKGNDKDNCVKDAKAAYTRAKGGEEVSHAKATGTAKDVSEARRDAVKDDNDANYKAAKERCDAMSGDAKTKCQNDVAAKFKK